MIEIIKNYFNDLINKVNSADLFKNYFEAFVILFFGILGSIIMYKLVMYIFKRFEIIKLLDKLDIDFNNEEKQTNKKTNKVEIKKITFSEKLGKKVKIDDIVAKSIAYYIILLSIRESIKSIGFNDLELFMSDIVGYLPKLFIGFLIGFFGIRFANFIYEVIYHALSLTKQKTAKILASGAKIVLLFFTLMAVLNHVQILDDIILNSIIIGFISMLTIAGGLAFGLGGKEIAREILESLKK